MAKKRKAGDGLIRQRADGRWEGRYVVGYDDHGYPKTKAVFGKSKRECTEKLAALKAQLGGIPSDKLRPEMRFADWLDYWYETHCKPNIRTSTQSGYEDRIRLHIKPELGEIPLNRLTQNDLQQFYARLKNSGRKTRTEYYGEGLSDRMVRMCHATCRSALQRAVQDGLIRTNPAEGCKLPPKKAREMQVLARDELQRFLIQAQAEGYYELFLLDLATGLRRGELLALQWNDLDFETGVLTISKQVSLVRGKIVMSVPKTKSSIRKLVLPPAVVQVLKEYRESVHSRWMFPSPVLEDLPLNPGSVYDRLQLILEHASCKQVRFHDLRHPYVKHTTKIFSLCLMDFQAQAYPDARRKTRGACQLHQGGQSRSPVRLLCNRKQLSCLPPQSKMSWILYAISMRLSGDTSTRSISSSASSVVSASASKIALDASFRLSCRACSSCFCFACANTAA